LKALIRIKVPDPEPCARSSSTVQWRIVTIRGTMLQSVLATLSMMMLFASGTMPAGEPAHPMPAGLLQSRIQQYIVIRVSRLPPERMSIPAQPIPPLEWSERKADKCIRTEELTPVAFARPDSVDLMLVNGRRMRAKLDSDCSALDFYSGFYIKPREDGQLCAHRDSFRSRSGGECQIKAFRTLVPTR
jgi:hypothetical protein